MTSLKKLLKLAALGLVAVATAVGLSTALPQPTQAQTGLTIFGGVEIEYRLRYMIDFNYPRSTNSRYYLNIMRNKLPRDVISLEIDYPDSFTEIGGRFDPNAIELRKGDWRGGEVIPVKAIDWIQDENRIEIIPEQPIEANTDLVVVLSNVRNTRRYGYHYFNLRMMYQGDVVNQYVGTWPMEIASESNHDR
ncbi:MULTISPECIES: DUF2808 domain-containing protein [Cyanophyceae]|uniref:DUF2808 domain-containing protein n=1 Tax=Cyanophyceae TaxID=3028117 RepID=UPI001685DDA6|nr:MULTISPECIES: DUF2808 domain-containing protein [Cyanophyceae]MBD1914992.1 DUF2808 domain-containing protein [Phormidium sp. FACHB-77]MBD2032779.1 DUF2808 domain-containing protein [Phormidium sp. FACHB-322]MBD2049924.1 DUF2808 domain-containing protein [Leptolyngbya sp. FACHB-60]